MIQKIRKTLGVTTLALSIVFFVLGVYFPLLSTKTRVLGINWSFETITLFDSISMFFKNKEYFLAGVILVFTFILPVLKYIELIIRASKNKTSKILQNLDKWNMLDVFLVALLILNFQMSSNIIVMELRIGTSFIALSVIFRILAMGLIRKT